MKRVKRPHGLLPKSPQKGDKITVVIDGKVVQALVRRSTGGRKIEHRRRGTFMASGNGRGGSVFRKEEGLTWARGWDTEAADALRVAVAL